MRRRGRRLRGENARKRLEELCRSTSLCAKP
jgi:hypothetical protein